MEPILIPHKKSVALGHFWYTDGTVAGRWRDSTREGLQSAILASVVAGCSLIVLLYPTKRRVTS